MKLNDEQQAAIDGLSFQQKATFEAKRSLLRSEAALVEGKTSDLEDEVLRDAKLLLRTQRQAYRETHRDTVISFEQRYSLVTTIDGFEPQENPPVYVKQGG